ncbi:hypothetical protein [Muribacter muris]|uniref:hypothetical protein n=1 Tax=Muribacter muris TaxID=67855 RepID=UPI00064DB18A|nr:hypothetical protein [Muribacter muris]
MEHYLDQAATMTFTDKLNFTLALLEQGDIDEPEAYQILTATGKPKPQASPDTAGATIDYF